MCLCGWWWCVTNTLFGTGGDGVDDGRETHTHKHQCNEKEIIQYHTANSKHSVLLLSIGVIYLSWHFCGGLVSTLRCSRFSAEAHSRNAYMQANNDQSFEIEAQCRTHEPRPPLTGVSIKRDRVANVRSQFAPS